jgi:hypothetical protein
VKRRTILLSSLASFASLETVFTIAIALAAPTSVNVEAVMKRFLPSKFPISSMLMTAAGCLRDVELRFVTLFRETIRNSHGRAPDNIAADALYKDDQEVFALLPDSERNLVQSMIVRMGLARGGYLGKRGLLLKSEVGFYDTQIQGNPVTYNIVNFV